MASWIFFFSLVALSFSYCADCALMQHSMARPFPTSETERTDADNAVAHPAQREQEVSADSAKTSANSVRDPPLQGSGE
jgi:hypothetical protein